MTDGPPEYFAYSTGSVWSERGLSPSPSARSLFRGASEPPEGWLDSCAAWLSDPEPSHHCTNTGVDPDIGELLGRKTTIIPHASAHARGRTMRRAEQLIASPGSVDSAAHNVLVGRSVVLGAQAAPTWSRGQAGIRAHPLKWPAAAAG